MTNALRRSKNGCAFCLSFCVPEKDAMKNGIGSVMSGNSAPSLLLGSSQSICSEQSDELSSWPAAPAVPTGQIGENCCEPWSAFVFNDCALTCINALCYP